MLALLFKSRLSVFDCTMIAVFVTVVQEVGLWSLLLGIPALVVCAGFSVLMEDHAT